MVSLAVNRRPTMTPTTRTKKPRKKPRKQPAIDYKGWKIRRVAEDVWQSDNMGKF